MRTWKNYLCMLAALVVTLGFTSCESDEDIGFDLSGLYGVTWFGDMGAGDSWGEPLDSYITFTSGSRPDHGVGTEDLYYTGVCQNCRLVRRGDGIARFSFGTLPLQFYFTTTLYPPVCPPNSGA